MTTYGNDQFLAHVEQSRARLLGDAGFESNRAKIRKLEILVTKLSLSVSDLSNKLRLHETEIQQLRREVLDMMDPDDAFCMQCHCRRDQTPRCVMNCPCHQVDRS